VQVQINGAGPLLFALDTAFPYSLIDSESAKALKLPYVHGGASSSNSPKFVEFDAKVGDVNITQEMAKVVSLDALPSMLGIKIDGIFGMDLFHRYGITINYLTSAITFADNKLISAPADAISLPLTETSKGLIIPIQIDPQGTKSTVVYAKIDTGLTDAIQITDDYLLKNKVLSPTQPVVLAPIGYGESTPDEKIYVTRLSEIKIGTLTFSSPVAIHNNDVTPRPYAVTLGGELLRRFTISFDLPHSKVYLVPNNSASDPFLFDASGITIKASGPNLRTYTITDVRPYSAGSEAQFKIGDAISKIDGQPADSLTLNDIRSMFCVPGKSYNALVIHDGKSRVVYLKTKSRI
jgi:predicted aspartyl protease